MDSTVEMAKVAKLLYLTDEGKTHLFVGKGLDGIDEGMYTRNAVISMVTLYIEIVKLWWFIFLFPSGRNLAIALCV